jgi:siroheme synthase (precorrin-2 oxidase/ferrochelatase)
MPRSPADHGVPYFPAFLDLVRKRVVVVGGGQTATNKVRALVPCRPEPLIVIAPQVTAVVERYAQ